MPALILMYHDLAADPGSAPAEHRPYVLDPVTFRRQMEQVARSGLRISTVSEWRSKSRPGRALIPTFDDGHVSNHALALPILRDLGLKATFFITVGRIGDGTTMDWPQIRALRDAGMEIGSHTMTHRPPSTLNDDEMRYELSESRRVLEDGLGVPVHSISSPTGFFNVRMSAIAQEVGYRALCIGRAGLAADGGDPFALNRIAVKQTVNRKQFEALLRFDRITLGAMRSRQWLRESARNIMGVESYLRLRRMLLGTQTRTD
jgi:peptidoglycan/xylan/chitin deacetylase (PgdA/CDA1 family)